MKRAALALTVFAISFAAVISPGGRLRHRRSDRDRSERQSAHRAARSFGAAALAEEIPLPRRIVVCTEPRRPHDADIEILSVEDFLSDLWDGKIV
jgi:hypothetical protein